MTKTFIIKSAAAGIASSQFIQFDPVTGKQYTTRSEIVTEAEKKEFRDNLSYWKNKFYTHFKPMLAKGGFIFDPTLWKWSYSSPNPYCYTLWVTITFVDDSGSGKTLFMSDLKKTGIMNYDFEILKPYS